LFEPSLEPTINSREIYRGSVVSLRVDKVRLPEGLETIREVVEHSDAVAVVPIDTNGNIVMVRQYRKAVEQKLLEVPAGGVEEGEFPEEAARRELREETGYTAGSIEPLVRFYTSPGFCTELMHVFLARKLSLGETKPDPDEIIQVVSISMEDILGMVRRGDIKDSKSIASILLAQHFLGDTA
jgi:ADP-ribose pyrophosphatase